MSLMETCKKQVKDSKKRYKKYPCYTNKQLLRRAERLLEAAKRAAWRVRLQKAKGEWKNL